MIRKITNNPDSILPFRLYLEKNISSPIEKSFQPTSNFVPCIYNYWNDWTAPDTNADGIVDHPYSIAGASNNTDLHPLVNPVFLNDF